MPSLLDLEAEYTEMTVRNLGRGQTLMGSDDKQCLAISTLGDWTLTPYSWSRFQRWLAPLRDACILYDPVGAGGGQLHWTLQQCQPFTAAPASLRLRLRLQDWSALEPVFDELRGLEIVYRGLAVTTSGLVLRGFPANERQYQGILKARSMLPGLFKEMDLDYKEPYANTICHATVLRWTKTPSPEQLQYISTTIHIWDESVLARLRPRNWIVGHLTLTVSLRDCVVLTTYYAPQRIAHRGLLRGPDHSIENTVALLESNAAAGITSECDLWILDNDGSYWLGHDAPENQVSWSWIETMRESLLIHAKDLPTFHELRRRRDQEGVDLHIFYHTDEDVVVTSHGLCIVYPGLPVLDGWMSMMPERAPLCEIKGRAVAVCSDYWS